MKNTVSFSLGEIAQAVDAELIGDASAVVNHIASVDNAGPDSITFITGRKFLTALKQATPTAVIVPVELAAAVDTSRLLSKDPYLAYAKLTRLWADAMLPDSCASIHPSASIDNTARIGTGATIEAGAVIQGNVVISANVRIGAGAVVGVGCEIGEGTDVHPNVTLMYGVTVGNNSEIHSGAVIGADGFGWAPVADGWEKIHQLGGVRIGDRVSIGACTTVDRGALDDTIIEDGVILDNQIQVAHNVIIGKNTAIAGCTGIAGSTVIGKNCRIGGAVSIVGHISICDDVLVTANSFVNRSIREPGSYSSGYPLEESKTWRKNAVRLHRLDQLARNVIQKS